mgnify:CR=1 FL=1
MATIALTPIEGYAHLARDPGGVAVLRDKPRMRVVDVAAAHRCKYRPEDLRDDLPWLDLPELYQAIAYYLSHREEIERDLLAQENAVEELRQLGKVPPGHPGPDADR